MMPFSKRACSPGQLQFVTSSTYRRAPFFSPSSQKSLREIADPKEQGSAPASARLTVELPYEIVGDRRRSKSLKLAGFGLALSPNFDPLRTSIHLAG